MDLGFKYLSTPKRCMTCTLKVVIKKQAPIARIRLLFALQGMAPTPPPLNALLLALFVSPLIALF